MPLRDLPKRPKAFVRQGTIPAMTKMATHLTVARKAVRLIQQIEAKLAAEGATKEGLALALREIARFADISASEARDAIKTLKVMRTKVRKYRGELRNAVD